MSFAYVSAFLLSHYVSVWCVCLSVCMSVRLCMCLDVRLYMCLSAPLSSRLPVCRECVCVCVNFCVCVCVCVCEGAKA